MIQSDTFHRFDPGRVPSPCFVVDEWAVERNLQVLQRVHTESGARVLVALKAFSMFSLAPLLARYLQGTCASGLYEARLAHEEFRDANGDGEVHCHCPAFSEADLKEVLRIADHVVLNSFGQWHRFQGLIRAAKAACPQLKLGLRINPLHSECSTPIYDPCADGSRLGIPRHEFDGQDLSGITGLHFHTLCEQRFGPLQRTLQAIETQFGPLLSQMQWVNFGGGHHITQTGYEVDPLIACIRDFAQKHGVQVYLEPGEAVAIRTGVLVSEVLDITHNKMDLAILDTSATCHMPDTLEMPYRAEIFGASKPGEKAHPYRLGGQTCLAGDVMGDYSFDQPLKVGQRLMFDDMSHYTMVKTTTFNGMRLPALAVWNSETDALRVVREFAYEDFKGRLS